MAGFRCNHENSLHSLHVTAIIPISLLILLRRHADVGGILQGIYDVYSRLLWSGPLVMHIQAVMMKHAKYDASATMYLDWIAYTDDSSFKAHIEQTETLHVATNFDFNTSVFDDTTIAKSVLLAHNQHWPEVGCAFVDGSRTHPRRKPDVCRHNCH